MKNKSMVVALALWLILVAFLAPLAQALPNHVISGGVFGPGGSVQPGPANPANAGSAVFYSTSQPTYPVLTEPVLTPADGTLPASFATDVGASWDWLPGDEITVVLETVRGQNLWAGVNYTTSVDGVLQLGGAIQDIGSGTMEQLPPLTMRSGPDYVNISWTALADANGNVVVYRVFRGPGPMGPFSPVGTVAHQAAASRSFNNTGLAPGQYCYNLGVDYRRDGTGGTYPTVGRSETQCVLATGAPYIRLTSPADGAVSVPRSESVRIEFSEAMDTTSVGVTFTPGITNEGRSWTAGDTVLTVTHALFLAATDYLVRVTGSDLGGTPLVPGLVPNPWTFTTNSPPTAAITAPGVGVCVTGGSDLVITWTMSDLETLRGDLRVWLNYSDGVTTAPIAGPLTGFSDPSSFTWTAPAIDATVTIVLEIMDETGEKAQETSPSVVIDSTRPTVANINPPSSATNVPTNAAIWLNFSEPMDRTLTEAAFSIAPGTAGPSFSWSNGDRTLRVSFTSLFAPDTPYVVTIGTGARDVCSPGLTLASAYTSGFRTGQGPTGLRPNPPTGLQASVTATSVILSWTAPTDYTDGRPLSAGDIVGYDVYRADSPTGTRTRVGTDVTTTSYTDTTVQAGATYSYWVKAKHRGGQESDFSSSVTATMPAPEGISIWLLLIPIVIVLLVIGAILLARRRKPEKPAEAPPPQPMEPEAPADETYGPGEQSGPGEGGGSDEDLP